MSIATEVKVIFSNKSPQFGYAGNMLTFDAVLEDELDMQTKILGYPVEKGVIVNDTKVVIPAKWTITGVVSNNPLGVAPGDFTGLLSSLVPDNGIISTLSGLGAGFLAGSDSTRSAATLVALIGLMSSQALLTVLAGDIKLINMSIIRITRAKNPENENGLVFQATLQELINLDDVTNNNTTTPKEDDRASIQASNSIDKGSKTGTVATTKQNSFIADGIGRFIL